MSEHDDPTEIGDGPAALRKYAEEQKRRADEAEKALAEMADAKRKLAMIEAGIDLQSPMGRLFSDAYRGDPTADAIAAAAAEYGITGQQQNAPAPQATAPVEERNAWDSMGKNARSGDSAPPTADLDARIRAAKSPQEVMDILAQADSALG